jgi:hypothetical protein
MTNLHPQDLLQSIANIIADYRQNEVPPIDANHVERWVCQFQKFGFDTDDRIVILEQMKLILNSYYFSYAKSEDFIAKVLASPKLFGSNPASAIRNVKFLQVQTKGNSQNDLLKVCEQILQTKYGILLDECGNSPVAYLYIDDCLYSGNRVRRDITSWLPSAVKGTILHLIFFAVHTEGLKYSERVIREAAKAYDVSIEFWRMYEFNNSRWNPSQFDCFWAHELSGDEYVDRYVQTVNEQRQQFNKQLPPLFCPDNMPTQESTFSSISARKIIESAFLKAGAYIISLPDQPNPNMRPLGYDYLKSLGFGSIFATYRNTANNCPLVLWWGDPNKPYPLNEWYPLLPRTVNIV